MLKTRYEEYQNIDGGIRFILSAGLIRTPDNLSDEANWHEDLEIQLCTGGEGFVLLDGEKHSFAVNDIIVVNSNTIHYTGTSEYLEYTCLIINSQFCKNVEIENTCLIFEEHFKSDALSELLGRLKAIYDGNDDCRTARLYITLAEILVELRVNHLAAEKERLSNASFEAVKECIRYIRKNYDRKIYIDDLAAAALTDKYKLSRIFKNFTNQTIVEYINRYRCLKVKELICDGASVSEAAMRCGFNNMSFFSKIFKRFMGELPSGFRIKI